MASRERRNSHESDELLSDKENSDVSNDARPEPQKLDPSRVDPFRGDIKEMNALKETVRELEGHNRYLQGVVKDRTQALDAAKKKYKDALAESDESAGKMKDYADGLEETLRHTIEKLDSLRQQHHSLQATVDSYRQMIERLESANRQMQGDLMRKDDALRELSAANAFLQQETEGGRMRVQDMTMRMRELEQAMRHNAAAALEFKSYLEASVDKNAQASAQLKEQEDMLRRLERESQDMRGDCARYGSFHAGTDQLMKACSASFKKYQEAKRTPGDTTPNADRVLILEEMIEVAATSYNRIVERLNMGRPE